MPDVGFQIYGAHTPAWHCVGTVYHNEDNGTADVYARYVPPAIIKNILEARDECADDWSVLLRGMEYSVQYLIPYPTSNDELVITIRADQPRDPQKPADSGLFLTAGERDGYMKDYEDKKFFARREDAVRAASAEFGARLRKD